MSDQTVSKQEMQRSVADKVTDEMLTTPVKDLTYTEVAILTAAMEGPHGQELVERIDNLLDRDEQD